MPYLIGTDEAGYGPNLGPLVISATLWRVPDGVISEDLYRQLAPAVVTSRREVAEQPHARIAMADSKALYQPGKGLQHLERGLWTAWDVLGCKPGTWRDVWRTLVPESINELTTVPWYAHYDRALPRDAELLDLTPPAEALHKALAAGEIRLLAMQSRAVFAGQFNRLLSQHGSKGSLLSNLTLELVARLMQSLGNHPISIICDKHGGRNRYAPLLGRHFPEALIEIHGEGRESSLYRFGPARRRVEIRFQTKAESHLPTALASMASKYLRELAMLAFNKFWCDRLPQLSPTAGYPQDAKRFKAAVATVQQELGIDENLLWREK